MNVVREIRYSLTDIPALLAALGMRGQRDGGGYKALCPAPGHDERTPSCSIRIAQDGTVACRCHGCGWSGDALGLVAVVYRFDRRADFREILRTAASLAGRWDLSDAIEGRPSATFVPRPRPVPPTRPSAPDVDTYHAIARAVLERCPLENAPDVSTYLERRALLDVAHVAGLAGLSRDQRPLVVALLEAFPRETLVRAGIVRAQHDAIEWGHAHRLLIPWRLPDGRIASLQRRRLDDGRPKYLFPPDLAPREPFGCELLDSADEEIIVTEGALDALARRKLARMRKERAVVVAIPSASTIRAEWSRYFRGRDVVIAFDADGAGEKAAERFAAEACGDARSITRETPRDAKDVNEVLLQEMGS